MDRVGLYESIIGEANMNKHGCVQLGGIGAIPMPNDEAQAMFRHPLVVCRCLSIAVLLLGLPRIALASDQSGAEKNVLIISGYSDEVESHDDDLYEPSIRARVPFPINFYFEHTELWRDQSADYQKSLVETLSNRYAGQTFDLVITASYPALQFAVRHRQGLFPGVPIVFLAVDANRIAGQKMWPGVTGVTLNVDVRDTVDLALRLRPDADVVAVVTGDSNFDEYWRGAIHNEIARHAGSLREIDLVGIPSDELVKQIHSLPPTAVAIFFQFSQQSVQAAMGPYDLLKVLGQQVPTFCIIPEQCLEHDGIGGASFDRNQQRSLGTALVARVLSGERPDDIPVINDTSHLTRVDWRQLQHWKIAESKLPAETVVLYREPTVWQRYRYYIIAAIAIIALQGFLIVALLWQRARKRKAEAVLRESEKRFRVMADTTPSLIWMCDQKGQVTYLNDRRAAFTGSDAGAGYRDTWIKYVHPDDVTHVTDALTWALKSRQSFSKEYRLRRHDGVYRWMFDVASPRMNGDGSFSGFIGSAIDITDQKLAHEALEKVGGRLIEAQEEERRRIARELHDDISQKLALLSMEIAGVQGSEYASSEGTKERLEEIRQHCSDVADDVQSLSHQLHSSKLDYLGVAAAIRGYCIELAKQYPVDVQFNTQDVPPHVPRNVALCLFRVAQEALHNAVKYSGTSEFAVHLTANANSIKLVITDSGVGFDVEQEESNSGLGLVSMRERVHLIGGVFLIESKIGEGTTVMVSVPLKSGTGSANDPDGQDRTIVGAA
jgi:PAS domain S-box-containing protein